MRQIDDMKDRGGSKGQNTFVRAVKSPKTWMFIAAFVVGLVIIASI